jgi:plastocyanin
MKPPGENIPVSINGFAFNPSELRIKVGQTVTWTNEDSSAHNVVANGRSFKSESLQKGESFSHTFDKGGTFDYVCTFHAPMKATIIVE